MKQVYCISVIIPADTEDQPRHQLLTDVTDVVLKWADETIPGHHWSDVLVKGELGEMADTP